MASLDVTAFLNAPLPEGRIVVLRPPTVFTSSIFCPLVTFGLSTKPFTDFAKPPVCGLKSAADALKNMTFTAAGELYSVLLSQIHRSLCLLVRQKSLHDHHPSTDHLGLTSRVPPEEVIALSGIYVDDFLTAGPEPVVRSFLASLRKMWKTSDATVSSQWILNYHS